MGGKPVLAVYIVFALASTLAFTLHIELVKAEPRTWTVDDNGPADFSTIQEAINNVNKGDSIYVYNGTYYENVVVNKSVSLIGEDRSVTIVDGNETGTVITVTQDNVNITGFAVQRSGIGFPASGIYLYRANNCNITNNNIANNYNGIYVYESSNNKIYGNNITINNLNGVHLYESSNNKIYGNNITENNYDGIYLFRFSNYNTISGNNIADNINGVYPYRSSNNRIFHNNFVKNANQVLLLSGYANTWDDGYPSGGNYWCNYTGLDLNYDGIGNSWYEIDEKNTDHYPLMGMFHSFNVSPGYDVDVISNSTIEGFLYFESRSTIEMYVSNMTANQTYGFCRVCIPKDLIAPPYNVTINDGTIEVLHFNETIDEDNTHRWIYFA